MTNTFRTCINDASCVCTSLVCVHFLAALSVSSYARTAYYRYVCQ